MSKSKKITVAMLNKTIDDVENNHLAEDIFMVQVGKLIDDLYKGKTVTLDIKPATIGGDETAIVGALILGLMKKSCTPAAYKRVLNATYELIKNKKEIF